MSLYMCCPTCGRLLSDKEIPYLEGMKEITKKHLSDDERREATEKLLESLKIPRNCYCCRQRIMTFRDLPEIIK